MYHGGKHDCTFEGEDGTIHVGRGELDSDPNKILETPLGAKDKRVYLATDHRKNWLECVKSRKPTICPAEVGHRTSTVCQLGNIGYRLRRKLAWDPAKEQLRRRGGATSSLDTRCGHRGSCEFEPKPRGCNPWASELIQPPPGSIGMQGKSEVIDALNRALTIELTAINQYFCQAKMCMNWGFRRLGAKHYEESMGEMKHAEKLIDRILFLEGVPEIARYDVIRVGTDVKEQFEHDLKLETKGVNAYNEAIDLCIKVKDNGTRELLSTILVESEEHVDWLETQLGLIAQVGLAELPAVSDRRGRGGSLSHRQGVPLVEVLPQPPVTGRAAVTGPGVPADVLDRVQVHRVEGAEQHVFRHLQAVTDHPGGAGLAVRSRLRGASRFHGVGPEEDVRREGAVETPSQQWYLSTTRRASQ